MVNATPPILRTLFPSHLSERQPFSPSPKVSVGFVGAGNYAGRVLMPAFKKAGATLHSVASSGGVSAVHYGKKFGFREATTDVSSLLESDEINAVVIATRHNTHARLVCEALRAGKHVFVEKPLCLNFAELDEIVELWNRGIVESKNNSTNQRFNGSTSLLMVGFNRRFAPQIVKMKELLSSIREPKSFVMTVNAGKIPADHWTQDPEVGGGRIVGEACHFVDLLRFLAGCSFEEGKRDRRKEDQRKKVRDEALRQDGLPSHLLTFLPSEVQPSHLLK